MHRDEGARGEGALRGENGQRGVAGLYRGEGALRGERGVAEDEDVLPAELAGRRGLADMNFMFVLQIFKFGFGGRKSRNETFAAVAVGTKLTNLYCKHAKIIKPLKILF